MIVSVHLSTQDYKIAKAYAKKHNLSLDIAMKNAFFEKVEDEYDIAVADSKISEYSKNPKTYTLNNIKKDLD